ncbi:MAG: hypothetical protein U0670_04625 [Anaerolineae bacterium]
MPDKQRLPSESDIELLSALIDGMLSDSERREVIARLDQEPQLQTAYAELQRTVDLLKALPAVRAPRNYTLTPDMVGLSAAETTSRRAGRTPRRTIPFPLTTAFSALSAAAAVILMVLGASMLTLTATAPPASTVGMLSSAAVATNPLPATEMGAAPTNVSLSADGTGANTGETASNSAAYGITTEESAPADAASRSMADETGTFYRVPGTATVSSTLADARAMESNAAGLTELQMQDAQQQPLMQSTFNPPLPTLYPPESYSQGFSEDNSVGTTSGEGGGSGDMSSGQQGGAASAAGAAMPFAQEVLPTMTYFAPLLETVVQGTLESAPSPLVAMQPAQSPGQAPAQPPAADQLAMPTSTRAPSTATKTLPPTDTPPPTVTDTPVPTFTATPIPVPPVSSSGGSTNGLFGIVLIGTALVFAALTAASVWARRRFDRTNAS